MELWQPSRNHGAKWLADEAKTVKVARDMEVIGVFGEVSELAN